MIRLGSLFTGYGGLDLAVCDVLDDVTVAWHAEIDLAARAVLAHHWPTVPNLGDVTAIEWDEVEPVDILTGGFPCQDVSLAGHRAGLRPGNRSGTWAHMAYAIDRLRPSLVVIENVRGLLSVDAASDVEPCPWCVGDRPGRSPLRALGAVLGDLADLGYDAIWRGLRAADVGAPHRRFRVFVLARPAVADSGRVPGIAGRLARSTEAPRWQPFGVATGRRDTRIVRTGLTADSDRSRLEGSESTRGHDLPSGCSAADTASIGRREGQREATRLRRRPDVAERGATAAVDWGPYGVAIGRWERLIGRPAPPPVGTGQRGGQQLTSRFVEWLMGLEPGYVTDVAGLTRSAQLRTLGNGVVWQQAAAAIRWLIEHWGDHEQHQ